MKKNNGKYTFSEAVEDAMGHIFPGIFKLDDTTKCIIEQHKKECELRYELHMLKIEHEEQGETLCKTYEQLDDVDKKYHKLSKENEKLTKQITEEKAKNDNLTNEVELLKQKDAMRENQFESLNEYIKLLESRLNNQDDDDTKLYPEYHTHDTFKVHNKLAEVVSVLVDKDDDVYGYEIKN